MVPTKDRLKLKRSQTDVWSTKEQLCLAASVLEHGDNDWMSVSFSMKNITNGSLLEEKFSENSCAVQYCNLLENMHIPKHKKYSGQSETPSEMLVRKLTQERIEELKRQLNKDRCDYAKLKDEVMQIKSGCVDERLIQISQEIDKGENHKIKSSKSFEMFNGHKEQEGEFEDN